MRYAQHRSNYRAPKPERSGDSSKRRLWIGLGLFAGAIIFVIILGRGVADESSVDEASQHIDEAEVVEDVEGLLGVDDIEEIDLFSADGSASTGIARRGTVTDLFTHVIIAEMPALDYSVHFYEGWLVKPGVVEFFSTGEVVPRADGKFALVWELGVEDFKQNVYEFTKVVITREVRNGDESPSVVHVLEGEF